VNLLLAVGGSHVTIKLTELAKFTHGLQQAFEPSTKRFFHSCMGEKSSGAGRLRELSLGNVRRTSKPFFPSSTAVPHVKTVAKASGPLSL
jgi:hypothetical protein